MTADEAKLTAAAVKVDSLYHERAAELMGLALGVGLTREESQRLVAARLAEWDSLRPLVTEFFSYLDAEEESDSGRVFHPVQFGCCRAAWVEPMTKLLESMREKVLGPRENA